MKSSASEPGLRSKIIKGNKNIVILTNFTLLKLKKFTSSFGFVADLLLRTISLPENVVVCSRCPFRLLVKFKL